MERMPMERALMQGALMQLNQPLCCDLTELYAGSLGRGGFYGIARVVAEIALALDGLVEPVQYVVFSASLQRFVRVVLPREQLLLGRPASFGFAVHRLFFALDQHGSRWLGRCPSALQAWLRRALEWLAAPWLSNPAQAVEPGVLFSAARPKFLARYPRAMQRQGLKLASLVHDFFPLLDTHDRPRQAFVDAFARDNRVVLENSDVVIANSFFTRDCLLQLQQSGQLPQPPKLAVAQLAHECRSPEGGVCTPLAHQHQRAFEAPAGGYFLAVGCRPGRKNLQLILEAWLLLHAQCQADGHLRTLPVLVLAGAIRGSIRRFVEQPRYGPIRSAIQWAASPTQAELVGLYQGAIATLLPSFSEGWGLPASESLWFGTPVVVSDTPVMREVCGDLGFYVDPSQPEALAHQIHQLVAQTDVLEGQRQRIAGSRASLRRWLATAQDVLEALC